MVRCRSGGCKRTHKREARGRQGFQRCPSVLASGRPEGARGSSGVPQSWQAGGQRAPGVPAVSLSPGKRESRGRPFGRGWGCPSVLGSGRPEGGALWQSPQSSYQYSSSHPGIPPTSSLRAQRSNPGGWQAGVQRAQPLAGVWGCPLVHISTPLPSTRALSSWEAGVQRAALEQGFPLQYSPSHPAFIHHCERSEAIRGAGKRESRGRSPLAGVWGCPPVHISTPLPIPPSPYSITASAAKQSGGWEAGVQRAPPFGRGLGVSPSTYQYSPSHPAFPLPRYCERSEAIRGAGKRESRGRSPLAGVWGCPPEFSIFSPLPSRKGARGMVRAIIEAKPRIAGGQRASPFWRAPRLPISCGMSRIA